MTPARDQIAACERAAARLRLLISQIAPIMGASDVLDEMKRDEAALVDAARTLHAVDGLGETEAGRQ